MTNKRNIKVFFYRVTQWLRIMPSIWMMRNPFKIYEFFKVVSDSALQKHHTVFDVGCGKGFQAQALASYCAKVIGVDINGEAIAEARWFLRHSWVEPKVKFLCAQLEEANLPASSIDRVFSFCVLEHIANLEKVLTEMVKVLKPGGELHLSVDSLATVKDPILLAKHKKDHFVVQYFTPELLRQQLEAVGLEVLEVLPILTSEFARREFETRIQQRHYSRDLISRIFIYRRLRNEDERSGRTEGIMLVGRARRPINSGV